MTTAIIIAAGEATRWRGHTGRPKHLVDVDGEVLLHRTVRQAADHADLVYVVSKPGDDRYQVPGAVRCDADLDPGNFGADKFLSSRGLWERQERTVVLYGDVYFTDDVMAEIFGYSQREWRLFCRFGPSAVTGCPWGECFAQSFYPEHLAEHELELRRIAELRRRRVISRCGGWEHARAMAGAPDLLLRTHRLYPNMIDVGDGWSDDFDKPEDYDRWTARRAAAAAAAAAAAGRS